MTGYFFLPFFCIIYLSSCLALAHKAILVSRTMTFYETREIVLRSTHNLEICHQGSHPLHQLPPKANKTRSTWLFLQSQSKLGTKVASRDLKKRQTTLAIRLVKESFEAICLICCCTAPCVICKYLTIKQRSSSLATLYSHYKSWHHIDSSALCR